MSDSLKEIGKRIRLIRGKKSLVDFGKIIGISKTMVSYYEDGSVAPRADTLQKIAEYGDVSFEWLFTGKEPMSAVVCEPINEDSSAGETEEGQIRKYTEKIVGYLEREGVERFVAEKMFEAVIREMQLSGRGDEAAITLGDFIKDAQKRERERTARQRQAADGRDDML